MIFYIGSRLLSVSESVKIYLIIRVVERYPVGAAIDFLYQAMTFLVSVYSTVDNVDFTRLKSCPEAYVAVLQTSRGNSPYRTAIIDIIV